MENIIKVVRTKRGTFLVNDMYDVPVDIRNADYRDVYEWIHQGNVPEEERPSKNILLSELNEGVKRCIEDKYDIGTQMTLQAVYAHPLTDDRVKGELLTVWRWIASVLRYYYECKEQIESGQTIATNFEHFNKTAPDVSLKDMVMNGNKEISSRTA